MRVSRTWGNRCAAMARSAGIAGPNVALLTLFLLVSSCGGTPSPPAGAPAPEESGERTAAVEPASVPSTGADPEPTSPAGDDVTDPLPALPGMDLPTFTTAASSASVDSQDERTPTLRAVRMGHHDGHDRLVFEFDTPGLPAWRVEYPDVPPADCGTGEATRTDGQAQLQIRFSGARAHTDQGEATSGPARRRSDLAILRELVRNCDFEGEVTWVAGVAAPGGQRPSYRPRVLASPSRLVIDLRP